MSSFLDLTSSTYSNLSQYAILASNSLIVSSVNNKVVINDGYWYGNPCQDKDISSGTTPSGFNSQLSTTALNELEILINSIINITDSLNTIYLSSGSDSNITFISNTKYILLEDPSWKNNTIIFDTQGNPNAQFFITCKATSITFRNCSFNLGKAKSCNIFWLCSGSELSEGIFSSSNSDIPGVIIAENIILVNDSPKSLNYYGHVFSQKYITLLCVSRGNINITSNSCGYTSVPVPEISPETNPIISQDLNPSPIVCFVKGSLILTKKGFIPIEDIKENNKIITKGIIINNKFIKNNDKFKLNTVLWVGKFKVFDLNKKSRPICIKKNALGKNTPFKDLFVSPRHSLIINGKKVLAKNIVNEKTIFQVNECDSLEYYHLECKNHCIIIANGIYSESYLNKNNKYIFENNNIIVNRES
jgi:hypothetical protein